MRVLLVRPHINKKITTVLPDLDFSPGVHDYVSIKKDGEWKIVPNCVGIACAINDSENLLIDILGQNPKYKWETTITKNSNTTPPLYYDSVTATCKVKDKEYTFTINNNGTIAGVDEKGQEFLKDPFKY